jgi:tetratricopeptide (TPR) repeat protein/tRNA A-37 threonylcarbamoyl transferase component Bud32
MGEVLAAFDLERGEQVALKRLLSIDPEALIRFKREFRVLADLRHENLVELYELAFDGDSWFFTMELLDGVPLTTHFAGAIAPSRSDTRLRTRWEPAPSKDAPQGDGVPLTPESLAHVRDVFAQIGCGLGALHAAGLLHRDVKPHNVLVTTKGRAVLVDFGIAAELHAPAALVSELTAPVGTPEYMAPEQCCGEPATAASDLYALGTTLFQVLTGRLPFATTGLAVMAEKMGAAAPRARDLRPELPRDLDDLCAALLAPLASERPTVADVLRALLPMPAVAAVEATVRAVEERPSGALFVGREAQLALLEGAFEDVVARRAPAVVLVDGRSGMGKSRLIRTFFARAQRAGAVVFDGRCHERETLPFKALDPIVDRLATYLAELPVAPLTAVLPREMSMLARLFPALLHVPTVVPPRKGTLADLGQARAQAGSTLRALLGAIADRTPTILFIDDIQWGDDDSAMLLKEILAGDSAPPLLVVLSCRAEHLGASPLERRLGEACALRRVGVGPLSDQDASVFASALVGRERGDPIVSAIARAAAGSPFFIEQLARQVSATGATGTLALESVIASRIAALPDDAQKLFRTVSIAGRPLDVALARDVAGVAPEALADALRALRAAGLAALRDPGRGERTIEPVHDRLREACVASLTADEIRACHSEFVERLRVRGLDDPLVLFVHCRDAGRSAEAIGFATAAAARSLAALAFGHAAELYASARALLPPDAWGARYEATFDIHLEEARALYLNDDVAAAEARFDALVARARSAHDAVVVCATRAMLTNARGKPDEALGHGIEALRRLGTVVSRRPSALRVLVALIMARILFALRPRDAILARSASPDRTHELIVQTLVDTAAPAFFVDKSLMVLLTALAFTRSLRHGAARATPTATAFMAVVFFHALRATRAGRALHALGQIQISTCPDPFIRGRALGMDAMLMIVWHEPFAVTRVALLEAIAESKKAGDILSALYRILMGMSHAIFSGESLERVERFADENAPFAIRARYVGSIDTFRLLRQGVRCLRGLTPHASSFQDSSFDEAAFAATYRAHSIRMPIQTYLHLKALVLYLRGDFEEAIAMTQKAVKTVAEDCFGLFSQVEAWYVHGLALGARADTAQDKRSLLRELSAAARTLARWRKIAPLHVAQRHALVAAELHRARGRVDDARRLYAEALAGARLHQNPRDEAIAAERASSLSLSMGDARGAGELLAVAREAYRRWGVPWKADLREPT